MDGWTDGWMHGWMDGWMDGWMNGGMVEHNYKREERCLQPSPTPPCTQGFRKPGPMGVQNLV